MWLEARRGRLGRLILALETSCDDTCAAVVDGARILSQRRSPRRPRSTSATAASCPRSPRATTSSWSTPVVDAALAEAGRRPRRRRRGRGHPGPRADRRAAGRAEHGEGARGGAPQAAGRRSITCTGHVAANFLEPDPLEPPFLCLIASGGHTLLAGRARATGYEVLGQTLDDAAGEALRQGRAAARPRLSGRPGDPERRPRTATRRRSSFPVAMSETAASTSASAA